MAHLENHNKLYRLVYMHNGQRVRIPLNTPNWHMACYRAYAYHNITLEGRTTSEIFFQIFGILESQISAESLKMYVNHWKHFASRFAKTSIDDITPQLLVTFRNELSEVHAQTGVSMILRSIQAVFSLMERLQCIKVNPFKQLKNFVPKTTLRTEYLTSDECVRLLDAASKSPLAQGYLKLLLSTGMRRGELYNLKWSDTTDGKLILTGKTGKREFPLWSQVKSALDQIRPYVPADQEYVLVTLEDHTRPFEPSYIGRIVKQYILKAGLVI